MNFPGKSFIASLIIFFFTAYPSNASLNDPDFSGWDKFVYITDQLLQDKLPSESDWSEMFLTTGYSALLNDEGIRKNIELVFLPSNSQRLDSVLLKAGYWRKRDLIHLIGVKNELEDLKKFRDRIKVNELIPKALTLAETYLPEGTTLKADPPPIRFVIFSPDARAMGGNIIFDLKFVKDIHEELFVMTIAHEVHHHYCNYLPPVIDPPQEESSYDPIYGTIRQLQLEGVADLIDKKAFLQFHSIDTTGGIVKKWNDAQASHYSKMKRFDSLLCRLDDDTTGIYDSGMEAFKMFPVNCHPDGNLMATMILENSGKDAIINSMNNPFEFFRLYRKACIEMNKEFVLSGKAMNFLNEMEKLFLPE